jgi:sulfatase maturation enzyme AslB (radical SAM superfamily)
LRLLNDRKGDALVDGVLALVRRQRPLHLSIVGGEPLVRWRELDALLPKLNTMGIEVQIVTSAVRPIPAHWADFECLHLVVSVDGLQPEHDLRRSPATYVRILKHIAGHDVIIHCTVTSQMVRRPGYLREFSEFWSGQREARKIWFSLFTPQHGEDCEERLSPENRKKAVEGIAAAAAEFPKVQMPRAVLEGYLNPPDSPADCVFAQTSHCVTADLETRIAPCQFGGRPVCAECGCMASAGLASIGRYKLAGLLPVSAVFAASRRIGTAVSGN